MSGKRGTLLAIVLWWAALGVLANVPAVPDLVELLVLLAVTANLFVQIRRWKGDRYRMRHARDHAAYRERLRRANEALNR